MPAPIAAYAATEAANKGLEFAKEWQKQRAEYNRRQQMADADWHRRDQLVIRGPPPKESVSMVKYMAIGVFIILALIIILVFGRAPEKAPEYQSIFNSFQPAP